MSTKAKKQSVISRAKSYNKALQEAYDYGYRDGYAAYGRFA